MVAIRNLIEIQNRKIRFAWYLDDKSAFLMQKDLIDLLNSPDISAQFILSLERIMILELSQSPHNFLQQYGATAGILNIVLN